MSFSTRGSVSLASITSIASDLLVAVFVLLVSPNFSVKTHSLTRSAPRRPVTATFIRCNDMTFSNNTQRITR
uniref:Uncharacterized protein n=1 Tax=Arundo donax TaxID=35708 RepID=A0A0A9FVF0_ARUDO